MCLFKLRGLVFTAAADFISAGTATNQVVEPSFHISELISQSNTPINSARLVTIPVSFKSVSVEFAAIWTQQSLATQQTKVQKRKKTPQSVEESRLYSALWSLNQSEVQQWFM